MICSYSPDNPVREAARGFISQSVVSQVHVFSKSEDAVDAFNSSSLPLIDMMLI